jgi:hypothetical protein
MSRDMVLVKGGCCLLVNMTSRSSREVGFDRSNQDFDELKLKLLAYVSDMHVFQSMLSIVAFLLSNEHQIIVVVWSLVTSHSQIVRIVRLSHAIGTLSARRFIMVGALGWGNG